MLGPIPVNLEDVIDGVPEGDYNVTVVDAEMKTSKAGNPYARWQLTVFDAPEAKFNGQAIWHSTPTTGKGAFRLIQLWRAAMGQKPDSKVTSIDPQQILGKKLSITVVNSHDQDGNLSGYTEVKSVRAYKPT